LTLFCLEAELHWAVGNERARSFDERMSWLHRGKLVAPSRRRFLRGCAVWPLAVLLT
jgi:hypothetical protein